MTATSELESTGTQILVRLYNEISHLIDGNHVERSEVRNQGGRYCAAHITYKVEWTFTPQVSEQRLYGNKATSIHFGYKRSAYDAETTHRCQLSRTHHPLRTPFINQILSAGGSSLSNANTSHEIWNFGQHSVHQQCNTCGGDGHVRCPSCYGSGRQSCSYCFGSGHTTQTRWVTDHRGNGHHETYQQACYHCGCTGRVNCGHCSGSGTEQCASCRGNGFFTDITTVSVHATPSVQINVHSQLSAKQLLGYLTQQNTATITRHLAFSILKTQNTMDETWQIQYEVHTTAVELDFSLRSKTYLAAAIGPSALTYLRPPVFDDIFTEELTDLQKIEITKKTKLSARRARTFFSTYSGQPVLDKAMQLVANLEREGFTSPSDAVNAACQGYISQASANALGKCMKSLLDKISPPNSFWSWMLVTSIPATVLTLGAQNWLERNPISGFWSLAGVGILVVALAFASVLLVSPIAVTVSAATSAYRRRSVPPEYRQKPRNWQPFGRFVRITLLFGLLGAASGSLSHHGYLPRMNNQPMQSIEQTLRLHKLPYYNQASAWMHFNGFFQPQSPTPH
ncbi:Hypothetical protein HDN1F_00180 [gamma proteobacterium HdN1]|nr:Hypothetical protein HDN1F_00180 [gamma proteobacterium HdN1]